MVNRPGMDSVFVQPHPARLGEAASSTRSPPGPPSSASSPHNIASGYEAFICGPDPYLAVARQALSQLSVPAQRIHVEQFLSLAENSFEATQAPAGIAATLDVTLDGQTRLLPWPPGTACSTS